MNALAKSHWYVRAWPNVCLSICAASIVAVHWWFGFRSTVPVIAGGAVGVLDGVLTFLGRQQFLPYASRAATFNAALLAHMHSPWTRGRNTVAVLALTVLGFVLLPGLAQPLMMSVYVLFASYAAVSYLLRAAIFFGASEHVEVPSN
jgi:hypothetical protein